MEATLSNGLPDKTALFRLLQTTGWNGIIALGEDKVHEAARQSWHVASAYAGDTLVGFGRIVSDGVYQALLCDVMVLPEYRKSGIGSAIVRRLLDRCREAGIVSVHLFAAKGKAGFYERFGFAERPADAPGMFWKERAVR